MSLKQHLVTKKVINVLSMTSLFILFNSHTFNMLEKIILKKTTSKKFEQELLIP